MEKLFLVTNPGSSSRKYALYKNGQEVCSLHFETEDKKLICTLKHSDGRTQKFTNGFKRIADTIRYTYNILTETGYLSVDDTLDGILARVVATGEFFNNDYIVDDECLRLLEEEKRRAPLHVPVIAAEISKCVETFPETPVIIISDSHFHHTRDEVHKLYAIDVDLANRAEIKRYGYHGLSMGAVRNYLRDHDLLPERVVACHLGSGASLTAIKGGYSYDTTMGYTPLEGVMMATRSGDIDPAAAIAIQRAIGEMVASMCGTDALVFTATIGERNAEIRRDIVAGLEYLGFKLDDQKNDAGLGDSDYIDISAKGSKPIYVIHTDEAAAMLRRAEILLTAQETK